MRRQALIKKSKPSVSEGINPSSEEAIRLAFEDEENSSEVRFDQISSPEAVETISKATKDFQLKHQLRVTVTKQTEELPDIPPDTGFKYSHPGEYGALGSCRIRIGKGENIIVALVWEDDFLIGYGIAAIVNGKCEIEIIDVDSFSRRNAGLADVIQISEQSFQVGVGHVVVDALLKKCPSPIYVDATHDSSQYVFKSLGFFNDIDSTNPCILKMG